MPWTSSPVFREKLKLLDMDEKLMNRSVNEGFSGGEKKRNEILQMAVLTPKLAILDETDSGLDIDPLKIVAQGVDAMRNPERAIIVVTHYQRLLNYIVPDFVHVLVDGAHRALGRPGTGTGIRATLPAGAVVRIMQSLGRGHTVATDRGYMYRVDAKGGDALGLSNAATAQAPPVHEGNFSEQMVWDPLKTVYDPEIPVNIVDLGLVYSCAIAPRSKAGAGFISKRP